VLTKANSLGKTMIDPKTLIFATLGCNMQHIARSGFLILFYKMRILVVVYKPSAT